MKQEFLYKLYEKHLEPVTDSFACCYNDMVNLDERQIGVFKNSRDSLLSILQEN